MEKETLEEEILNKIKFVLSVNNDAQAIRLLEQHGFKKLEGMYNEEEVKRLAFDFYYDMSHKMKVPENLISENETNVDIWFDKFKNKNKL